MLQSCQKRKIKAIAFFPENNRIRAEYITHNNKSTLDSIIEYRDDGTVEFITDFQHIPADTVPYFVTENTVELYDRYLTGTMYHFSKEEKMSKKLHFRNGLMHGTQYAYYPSGNLRVTSTYKKGNLDGEQYEYFENGVIRFHGQFHGKEQTGWSEYFDSLGRITKSIYFNNISEAIYIAHYDICKHPVNLVLFKRAIILLYG